MLNVFLFRLVERDGALFEVNLHQNIEVWGQPVNAREVLHFAFCILHLNLGHLRLRMEAAIVDRVYYGAGCSKSSGEKQVQVNRSWNCDGQQASTLSLTNAAWIPLLQSMD